MRINADDVPPMPGESPFDGAPIPLTPSVAITPFPVDALPEPIADMVTAVAEATQTDPVMAGTSALSALSACTGGHAEIEVRPGWREPLNLYTATIAAPGERKSAVQLTMTRPLLDIERQLADDGSDAHFEALTRQQVAKEAAQKLQRKAASAKDNDSAEAHADGISIDAVVEAFAKANLIEVPPIPRLLADDITPEAAAVVLAEQGGRLAILSAEGGVLDIIAGRYSGNIPNLDLWLKGHSGDPLKVDRIGRPPHYIPRPALTVGLMIQPEVLRVIAANRQFRGRGLLARFLYAWPVSKVGKRRIAAAPVEFGISERYAATVAALLGGMSEWGDDPAVLTLSPKAQEAMITIEEAIEPTLAGDGALAPLADWGAKYAGAIARLSGILHLARYGAEFGPTTSVSAETILAAARIGTCFKETAISVFAQMGADPVVAEAVYLLDRIARLRTAEVSERDMHHAAQSRFKTKADLMPAVAHLVDHGYLAPLPAEKPTGGRPASQRYRVHPDVLTEETKPTQP